jgi:hypothetical protein
MNQVVLALTKDNDYEYTKRFYKNGKFQDVFDCYRKGNAFYQTLRLAKFTMLN